MQKNENMILSTNAPTALEVILRHLVFVIDCIISTNGGIRISISPPKDKIKLLLWIGLGELLHHKVE